MQRLAILLLTSFASVACSGEAISLEEGDGGSGGGQAGGGGAASGGSGGSTANTGGTGGTSGTDGGVGGTTCTTPVFSNDCSAVTMFQCGFSATCEGGTIKASWHHHSDCGGPEDISNHSCEYVCPEACDADYMDWPSNGAELVSAMCVGEGGTGGAGGYGAGGYGGSAGAAGSGGTGECDIPSFSSDCSEVPYFQCGVSSHCEGNVATMSWHYHALCYGQEEIVSFSCTYPCPGNCDDNYMDWPADGQAFIDGICTP